MNKKKFKQNKKQKNNIAAQNADILPKKQKQPSARKSELQVKKIEYPEFICPRCGNPIEDLSAAIADKESGQPIHFNCVIEFLQKAEELKENEEIIYIGNGNFAVVYFENPKFRKKFKIMRLIEWEDKNKTYPWKSEIADLASRI